MMMTSEIVNCGGDYCVHPSEDGHTWSVVNGPTGTVRCSCGSRDEAIRLARELNEQSETETMYAVIVHTTVGTWTTHSTHHTEDEAQDQADMVHGRVVRLGVDGKPADVTHCPACDGDPMQCCCDTPWSSN